MPSPKLGLAFVLLLAVSMWFYVELVLIPFQRADAAAHGRPRGNLSDLYPRWLGARELLLRGRDPYSAEVTREIQEGYYGRPLDPKLPNDPKDEQAFAYPVYVVFLLAPTVALPFSAVQEGFRWLLVMITLASVWLWLRTLRWKPPGTIVLMLALLTIGSFPAVQGIKLQQLSLVVSGLIAASAALLVAGELAIAGVLLAIATIKPQLALPLVAWLLLWACGEWRRRRRFFWGFTAAMVALLAGSWYVLPGWVGRFREALVAYRQYTGGAGSALDVLTTPGLGHVFTVLILLALAVIGWRMHREPAGSEGFALVSALVLIATVVVVPSFAPYNQLLLLPAIFLLVRHWGLVWRRHALVRLTAAIAIGVVFWPWLAALALTIVSLFLPSQRVQQAWAMPLYTSLGIPLAVLALFAFLMRNFPEIGRLDGADSQA